jgi:hypothetical protein
VPIGRYGASVHIVRGLRQALLMIIAAAVVAAAAAGIWVAWRGGDFRISIGAVLMALAALLAISGGSVLNRSGTSETRAWLGSGPDREEASTGDALTAVGIFLFVSVPLFLVGGVLYGTG